MDCLEHRRSLCCLVILTEQGMEHSGGVGQGHLMRARYLSFGLLQDLPCS